MTPSTQASAGDKTWLDRALSLFTDTPRALAVTPDGSRVYAAGFHTGNQTTTVSSLIVSAPGMPGMPPPLTNHQGVPAPQTPRPGRGRT